MEYTQALYRVEQIGICKWRDREHASQLSSFVAGLEPAFQKLLYEWGTYLASAEAEAREWYYALKDKELVKPEEWEEYEQFEELMQGQSLEYIRQLELMKEHSGPIRQSRVYRAFLAHIVQDARTLTTLLAKPKPNKSVHSTGQQKKELHDHRPSGAPSEEPKRMSLKRNPDGGWSLRK